jgi:hypothetical protein
MSVGQNITTVVNVDSDSSQSTSDTIYPGDTEVEVWKGTISPSAKVTLSSVAIKAVGNIEPTDLQNFKFYLAGTQIGSTVQMGSDYVVKLNLAANPVTVTSGSKELKVVADVVKGTGRSVHFEIYTSAMVATDAEYGVNVPVQVSGNADWKALTIGHGTIILQVASDSPVSVGTTTDALIAKYVLKAYGERVKIENFVATSSNATLTAATIYVDGAEKGKADVATGTTIDTVDFYVEAGSSVTIEVRADTTSYPSSTIAFKLTAKGTTKSGSSVEAPAPQVSLDVVVPSLAISFSGQPAPFLAVAGSEPMVAKFKFEAKGSDAVIKEVKFSVASSSIATALKLKIGTNEWSGDWDGSKWKVSNINYTLPAGNVAYGEVSLTLASVSSDTDGSNAKVTLTDIKYSQAGQDKSDTPNKAGNDVFVYKATPKVTALTTGNVSKLSKGVPTVVTLYQWKVGATGNPVKVATTTLYVIKPDASATTTISTSSVKVYLGTQEVTSNVGLNVDSNLANATNTTGTIVISNSTSTFEVAAGSEITIEVKAEVTGVADGSYVKVYLLGDSTSTNNFVWNDGLKDVNGYLVEGLPAAGTDAYVIGVIK